MSCSDVFTTLPVENVIRYPDAMQACLSPSGHNGSM